MFNDGLVWNDDLQDYVDDGCWTQEKADAAQQAFEESQPENYNVTEADVKMLEARS